MVHDRTILMLVPLSRISCVNTMPAIKESLPLFKSEILASRQPIRDFLRSSGLVKVDHFRDLLQCLQPVAFALNLLDEADAHGVTLCELGLSWFTVWRDLLYAHWPPIFACLRCSTKMSQVISLCFQQPAQPRSRLTCEKTLSHLCGLLIEDLYGPFLSVRFAPPIT